MFRVQFPATSRFLAALMFSALVILPAAGANAGKLAFPGHPGGQVSSGHAAPVAIPAGLSGKRSYHVSGKNRSYGHSSQGKRSFRSHANRSHRGPAIHHLRDGRRWAGDFRRYDRRPHYGRAGDIAIVIGGALAAGEDDTVDSSGVILENGRCAAGAYCTLRLGRYSNSPKIITLNESGKAITEPGIE